MARVLAVIAARLNSSRLPGKQLLTLAGEPLIARIFQRLEQFSEIDEVVLATTADEYNQPLLEWAKKANKQAFSYNGDVNDVVDRVDAVVQAHGADIVVFCCGDSPLIEPSTLGKMISALQHNPGAEYVALHPASSGKATIHEGFYPYTRRVWQRIVSESTTAQLREHVGLVIPSFVAELKQIYVEDRAIFSRIKQRISVDTVADYQFMSELYRRWYAENEPQSIVSLPWVIEQLEEDRGLAALNHEVQQRSPDQLPMQVLVVTQCGGLAGLGHLTRSGVLVRRLQEQLAAAVTLWVQGDKVDASATELLSKTVMGWDESLAEKVIEWLENHPLDAVIFDLALIDNAADFSKMLQRLGGTTVRVAIDGLFEFSTHLEYIHVPSFYLSPEIIQKTDPAKISYGWDHYLLPNVEKATPPQPGKRLLVMTGGSDLGALGEQWPAMLDEQLTEPMEIIWIKGPFAAPPVISRNSPHQWQVLENPADLLSMMASGHYALCVYGVSFFELLQRGVPTVVLQVEGKPQEMAALIKADVATVANSPIEAVQQLPLLMNNPEQLANYHHRAPSLMGQESGASRLATRLEILTNLNSYPDHLGERSEGNS